MKAGEEQAWETLAGCRPPEVCRRADATYDEGSGRYDLLSLGQSFAIHTRDRSIGSQSGDGEIMLSRFRYFSHLSFLVYLGTARDVTPSGQWVKPADLQAGDIYYKGSHVLPLDGLAGRFDGGKDAFLQRAGQLGGQPLQFGDASVALYPLPKVPVAVILRESDEEFPARADLLFDSTCELHVPADIAWSVAMMSLLMLMT